MSVLPSTPVKVGPMTLPSATVPVHLTDETRAFLDSVIASIPVDKRGQLRLVVDWTQVRGLAADAQVGAHVTQIGKADLDAAAGAGWSQQKGGYVVGMVRLVW